MRDLIDSVFNPLLSWLGDVQARISSLYIPKGQHLDFNNYIGYFAFLGPYWMKLISTIFALAFIYFVAYVIVANLGVLQKFKNAVKWW